jgi:hypothetical protein
MKSFGIYACLAILTFCNSANAGGLGISGGSPDLSVYGKFKGYNDYQQEANDRQLQRALIEYQILNQAQQDTSPDARTQIFLEAAHNIDIRCEDLRAEGKYKTFLARNKECTSPQVLVLAEQMQIPNIDAIRKTMIYAEVISSKIDAGEITQERAFHILNNYDANN